MEAKEYRTIDKSGWERGEWDDEPDKAQWPDEETGLPCLIVRGPAGALCGYVGVPEGHPLYRIAYGQPISTEDRARVNRDEGIYPWHFDRPESLLECHGGLTYSGACGHADDESKGICHVPGEGEPDNVWWFGFDCAHSMDFSPKYDKLHERWDRDYRTFAYVRREVTKLARQLKEFDVAGLADEGA